MPKQQALRIYQEHEDGLSLRETAAKFHLSSSGLKRLLRNIRKWLAENGDDLPATLPPLPRERPRKFRIARLKAVDFVLRDFSEHPKGVRLKQIILKARVSPTTLKAYYLSGKLSKPAKKLLDRWWGRVVSNAEAA